MPLPTLEAPLAEIRKESDVLESLLASRQRWRELAELAADLIFETDAEGRFTLFVCKGATGLSERDMAGVPAAGLLLRQGDSAAGNPFSSRLPVKGARIWLRKPDGSGVSLLFYTVPLLASGNGFAGVRGLGLNIPESAATGQSLSSRSIPTGIIHRVTACLRSRPLAGLGIPAAFEAITEVLGAKGGLLLSPPELSAKMPDNALPGPQDGMSVLHRHPGNAMDTEALIGGELRQLQESGKIITPQAIVRNGRDVIICSGTVRYAAPILLALWRDKSGAWMQDDANLADACLASIASAIEMERLHHTMIRNAQFDPLTGLLNRRGFTFEVGRRLPRLDRERLSGTVLLVDLDRFSEVNAKYGLDIGDRTLQKVASEFRDAIRPTDLIGRLGGDIFGLWLDGADAFVAAERAEAFCQTGTPLPIEEPYRLTFSVGLASRSWDTSETSESLIERAGLALRSVKLAGGARWHASQEDSAV
ncbi:GGDEF domain-containing protein [Acetobacter sp. AN02]|uniref:sensor domain-containing diguanylate cyclase n=1 Tax=Acetobacter sp. AN02 TaxID=2894186 RepID=UPI00243460F1|nr:GGDEF domain-containing protein [Acetobacter sp. AN02]MDG6094174.1 GGDEF domain-containing protein [Acetobacter sp. AN02]